MTWATAMLTRRMMTRTTPVTVGTFMTTMVFASVTTGTAISYVTTRFVCRWNALRLVRSWTVLPSIGETSAASWRCAKGRVLGGANGLEREAQKMHTRDL